MTGRGIAVTIFLALLLLAALGTGSTEWYVLLLVVGLLYVFSLISVRVEAKRLIFRQALTPDRITRGETARLTATVSGRIVLPVVVRMAVYWPPTFVRTPQWFHMTLLPGRQPPWLDQAFASPHRGLWRWGVARARVLDLFGLFSLPVRPEVPAAGPPTFTVYPRIYELDIQPAVSAMYLEDAPVQSLLRDYGDSFAGTRLYQHGDSFKRIHWKQTIRTREMHTRQYELSTEQFTWLLLDTGAPGWADILGYADMATETLGTLAWFLLQEKQAVQLTAVGQTALTQSAWGEEDFLDLYTQLAEVPFGPSDQALDLADLPEIQQGSMRSVYLLTHRPSLELLETLQTITAHHCQAVCLCPDFPAARQLTASCPPDVQLLFITRPTDIFDQLGDRL